MDKMRLPKGFIVPTDVLNKILNYLATRPFSEVHELIQELTSKAKSADVNAPASEGVPVSE